MKILGKKVTDRITGFTGIVTGYVTYISGCNQVLIVPKVGEDGKLTEAEWFDEQRVVVAPDDPIELDNSAGAGFDKAPHK